VSTYDRTTDNHISATSSSKSTDYHKQAFIKLMKRKIPTVLLELLENLFRECYSCVKWNNIMSIFFTINFGVRQGSVLSQYLFAVYVNDVDCSSPGRHVFMLMI